MKAVVYARYSSDLQREASIEDQIRQCKARIEQQGWDYLCAYTDRAQSGASALRPAYQSLLEDARHNKFDVVVAEALDRLSRDQEDVAGLFKRLRFAGIRLLTLSEGEITELHVGLRGTMNALFLKDLAQKVRRGLEGRVREGRSGGGRGYGYEVVKEYDSGGEQIRGGRKINVAEAAAVVRIFREFVAGRSPRAIAKALNAEGIAGPFAGTWGPSTIYGNWRRGTGILNNELYAGRLVWNRQRFVKDPVTGRRVGRQNPESEWVVEKVEQLRIVDEELWTFAKQRQASIREAIRFGSNHRFERARRPAYLFSSLLRCGECGGGFSKRSEQHYGCSNARNRGTCKNRLMMRRDSLEASVLSGLKTHLMRPELVKEFIAEYHRERDRLNTARGLEDNLRRDELRRVEHHIRAIIDAIKDGMRTTSMRDELITLESRKDQLRSSLERTGEPELPRVDSRLTELYRRKIERLQDELGREELRAEAGEILRSLIGEIRLVPEDGKLEIEIVGRFAEIIAFASMGPRRRAADGAQITMVAGEGFEPPTLGL